MLVQYDLIIFCIVWGANYPNEVAYLNKSQHYGPSNSSGYYSPPSTCVHPLDSQLSIDKSNLIAWEKHRWLMARRSLQVGPRLHILQKDTNCFWHFCFYSKSICKNHQRYILHVFVHLFYIFQIEPFCVFSRAIDSEYPRGYQHTKLQKQNKKKLYIHKIYE